MTKIADPNAIIYRQMKLGRIMDLDLKEIERECKELWSEEDIFKVDLVNGDRNSYFMIDTPPPTISGKMHLGHAFSYPHQDFIARYKRMRGYRVFYPWGFDDNGLPTERYTEKTLGIKGEKLPLREFIELCKREAEKSSIELLEGWRDLGLSADFKHHYRTFSRESMRISQRMFLDLLKRNRVYREEAPTVFCPVCNTAISQIEFKDQIMSTDFVFIKFPVGDSNITIATTRPEMLASCAAIIVNPSDDRFREFAEKKAIVPLYGFSVPILSDEYVSMDKGTGAEMLCTFGDQNDLMLWRKYNTDLRIIIDSHGIMNESAGKLKGMRIGDARKAVIEELSREGYIEKIEKIKHNVITHERCGTPVEIGVSRQWFVRYLDLKDGLLSFSMNLNWVPDYMKVRLRNWIEGLKWDWCISRQRFIGVPFPVWYCGSCGSITTASEDVLPVDPRIDNPPAGCIKCGSTDLIPDTDVMDTWGTSSLSPRLALQNEKVGDEFLKYDARFQGHDIINFWAFTTLVRSYIHDGFHPWENIIISGNVYDPLGQKMSKSKGNVVSPSTLIDEYGSDAVRYWAATTLPGEDIKVRDQDFVRGKRTVVKIFNAAKLVSMLSEGKEIHTEDFRPLSPVNRWMAARLDEAIRKTTDHLEAYNVSRARQEIDSMFWRDFCDNYLEICKGLAQSSQSDDEMISAMNYFMLQILKLYAPILPFITEHIYQQSPWKRKKSIHLESWPEEMRAEYDGKFEEVINAISQIRNLKTAMKLSMGAEIEKASVTGDYNVLLANRETIQRVMRVRELDITAQTGK